MTVWEQLEQIRGSNYLTDEEKQKERWRVKSEALAEAAQKFVGQPIVMDGAVFTLLGAQALENRGYHCFNFSVTAKRLDTGEDVIDPLNWNHIYNPPVLDRNYEKNLDSVIKQLIREAAPQWPQSA